MTRISLLAARIELLRGARLAGRAFRVSGGGLLCEPAVLDLQGAAEQLADGFRLRRNLRLSRSPGFDLIVTAASVTPNPYFPNHELEIKPELKSVLFTGPSAFSS